MGEFTVVTGQRVIVVRDAPPGTRAKWVIFV